MDYKFPFVILILGVANFGQKIKIKNFKQSMICVPLL